MSLDFIPTLVPTDEVTADPLQDEKPATAYEYACGTCGKELFYAGKGRKPKFCDEHKKNAPKSGVSKSRGASTQLAAQATDLIINVTDVLQVAALASGFEDTADAIEDKQAVLRERVYSALLANPTRCRSIIKLLGGTTDLGLAIAIGTFAANIGATAFNEYKAKRRDKEEQEYAA